MKKTFALLLALAMIFTLCACTKNAEAVETPEVSESAEPESPLSKVVTIGPNCTEVFCILGLQDRIVGSCMTNHSLGALSELAADVSGIPVLCEGYPTVDEIVKSGCNFVYAYKWAFTDDFTYEELTANGITVYISDAVTYDEIWAEIRDIAELFDVKDTAEEYISSQAERIDAVNAALEDTEPVKVLVYDSYAGGGYIYTAGAGNLETRFIETAGGVNICEDSEREWSGISIEDIAKANPDFIIIHDYSGTSYDDKVKFLKTDPLLSQLECVQNDCFIRISLENTFCGSRTAETVELFAAAFHPDIITVKSWNS